MMSRSITVAKRLARRRNFSTQASDKLWQLSTYKYFIPLQTRFRDNDSYGHLNYAVYYALAGLMTTRYITRYCDGDAYKQFTVEANCQYRSSLRYPEVAVGGLGVTKIGKSSVHLKIALFKPKKLYQSDPLKESGISLYGSFSQDINLSCLYDSYHTEAAALVHTAQVMVDSDTERPVAALPEVAVESFNKVFINN